MRTTRLLWIALVAGIFGVSGCNNTGGGESSSESISSASLALEGDGIAADLVINGDWGTGYSVQVTLRNRGAVPTTGWSVDVDMRGSTLQSNWRSVTTTKGTLKVFSPETYNAVIAPGGTESFGFQGNATNSSQRPILVAVRRTIASGTGGASSTGGTSGTGGSKTGTTTAGGGSSSGGTSSSGGSVGIGGTPGTGGSAGSSSTEYSLSIKIPTDTRVGSVVLGATNRLLIGDYAKVPPVAGLSVWPTLSNSGTVSTELAGYSNIGNLQAAGTVNVRNYASILGKLVATDYIHEPAGSVAEWIKAAPTFTTYTRTVKVPVIPENWEYFDDAGPIELSPGAYGNYTIRGASSLNLAKGRYFFRSLVIEPNVGLNINGSSGNVFVYVLNNFTFRGNEQLSSPSDNLFVGVFGNNDTTVEKQFTGAIVAPNSRLYISDLKGGIHSGQFFAKDIEVRSASYVDLRAFNGLWDDSDECTWGEPEGDTCAFDIACPLPAVRRCLQGSCACDITNGAVPPTDGCSSAKSNGAGQYVLKNAAEGTTCTPKYSCSAAATCDAIGYCHCEGTTPPNECTIIDAVTATTIRPVMDGTGCTSYPGSCTVSTTCAGGVCNCSVPPVTKGVNPSCVENGSTTECVGDSCLKGTCNVANECICPTATPMVPGHPIRGGTQNVAAIPTIVTNKQIAYAGCDDGWYLDQGCQAEKLADKIKQSSYDFIALNEAFDDDDYRPKIVEKLYDKGNGPYPYLVSRMDDGLGMNSGLMFASRWPFAPRDPADEVCFDAANLTVLGGNPTLVPIPNTTVGTEPVTVAIYLDNAVAFESYKDVYGPDGLANKGIGFARVVAPHGRVVNVFFTHLNAVDKSMQHTIEAGIPGGASGDESKFVQLRESARVRKKQLARVNEIIQCVMSHRNAQNEAVVFMGDLNVQGDLSNPAGVSYDKAGHFEYPPDCKPTDEFCYPKWVYDDPLYDEDPIETRNEWEDNFSWGPDKKEFTHLPVVNASSLYDTWSYDMTPSCVPPVGSTLPDPLCSVIGSIRGSEDGTEVPVPTSFQSGPVAFDRGVTWALSQTKEERLDYILAGHSPGFAEFASLPQHVAKAYNLFAGNNDSSSFSRNTASNNLGGSDPISDHVGLNAELDDPAANMSPAKAIEPKKITASTVEYAEEGKLAYPTAVQWFVIREQGDYAFAVNPKYYGKTGGGVGPDNGLSFQVFEATDLSKPLEPFKNEIIEVPPRNYECIADAGGDECFFFNRTPGYRSGKFKTPNFPLYVKVFASNPEKLKASNGAYVFYAKRTDCSSAIEACTMLPYERLIRYKNELPYQGIWANRRANETWYTFTLERQDSQWAQDLEFFVAEKTTNARFIDSVAVYQADGVTVVPEVQFTVTTEISDKGESLRVWRYTETGKGIIGGSEGVLRKAVATAGPEGKKYFMRVLKRPDASEGSIISGWSTNLTWIYGPSFGGPQCLLEVKDTQEVGSDEIWLKMSVCDADGTCDGFPELGGEAKDGVEFSGSFNEGAAAEWTGRFFPGLSKLKTHPSGATYNEVPALGATRDIRLHLFEDDAEYDEEEKTTYRLDDFPKRPEFISDSHKVIFSDSVDDGEYHVRGCTFAHYLNAKGCSSSSACNPILACVAGKCIQP